MVVRLRDVTINLFTVSVSAAILRLWIVSFMSPSEALVRNCVLRHRTSTLSLNECPGQAVIITHPSHPYVRQVRVAKGEVRHVCGCHVRGIAT